MPGAFQSSSQAVNLPRNSAASRSVRGLKVVDGYSRASFSARRKSSSCACSGKLCAFRKIFSAVLTIQRYHYKGFTQGGFTTADFRASPVEECSVKRPLFPGGIWWPRRGSRDRQQ